MSNKIEEIRVRQGLPSLVTEFYAIHSKDPFIFDYDVHMLLGRVISDINNPLYAIRDHGVELRYTAKLTDMILLQLLVQKLHLHIKMVRKKE